MNGESSGARGGDTRPWWEARAAEVEAILAAYPVRRSALLPLLHLAQESRGYLVAEDLQQVAGLIGETRAYVESVASFYGLYRWAPQGQFEITVCRNLSCELLGAAAVAGALEAALGVREGETTPDGRFTLRETHECLAACDGAPCLQVNLRYVLHLTPERARWLVGELRRHGEAALRAVEDRGARDGEEGAGVRARSDQGH